MDKAYVHKGVDPGTVKQAVGLIDFVEVGNARTEMVETLIEREQAAGRAAPFTMDVQLVAGAVLHMAELPQEANVLFQTIMATKMPLVGRG